MSKEIENRRSALKTLLGGAAAILSVPLLGRTVKAESPVTIPNENVLGRNIHPGICISERDIVHQCRLLGKSYQEIAEFMSIPVDTVKALCYMPVDRTGAMFPMVMHPPKRSLSSMLPRVTPGKPMEMPMKHHPGLDRNCFLRGQLRGMDFNLYPRSIREVNVPSIEWIKGAKKDAGKLPTMTAHIVLDIHKIDQEQMKALAGFMWNLELPEDEHNPGRTTDRFSISLCTPEGDITRVLYLSKARITHLKQNDHGHCIIAHMTVSFDDVEDTYC